MPDHHGYIRKQFVAFDEKASSEPMFIKLHIGTHYRFVFDLADATLWNTREDIELYFKALHPDLLPHLTVAEVELKVLRG